MLFHFTARDFDQKLREYEYRKWAETNFPEKRNDPSGSTEDNKK